MSHPIDALAAEYWDFYLDEQPTSAHLLGDYSRAGQFESATRQSEDDQVEQLRGFVRRAGELADDSLTDQQRLTRDVLVDDAPLPACVHAGDVLAMPVAGAYHLSMASTYNQVGRPPVVAVRGGRARLLVRRETWADLDERDVGD